MRSAMRGLTVILLVAGAILCLNFPIAPSQRYTFGRCLELQMTSNEVFIRDTSLPTAPKTCTPNLIVPTGPLVGAGWLV